MFSGKSENIALLWIDDSRKVHFNGIDHTTMLPSKKGSTIAKHISEGTQIAILMISKGDNKMTQHKSLLLLTGFLLLFFCSPVPLTGRRQLNLVPQSQMLALSFQSYSEYIAEHQVVRGTRESDLVQSVGRNIQRAVEQYFRDQGNPEILDGYAWEYNLVQDTQANAFAMPGGKVAINTGILPVTQTEEGLAVVMGHEIAHAVARHGNERMSQLLLVQLGGLALSEALRAQPELTRQLALAAFGLGAQVGILLPYSRVQETEADRLGLIFMAMAGYNPEVAVEFWQRMAKLGGAAPPEFLSTHPSGQTRVDNIQKMLPEAMKYYRKG